MINQPQPFDELFFCDVLIEHYRELYRRRMKGRQFVKAAFAWKRWQYYKRLQKELGSCVNDLLTEINKTHVAKPLITTAG